VNGDRFGYPIARLAVAANCFRVAQSATFNTILPRSWGAPPSIWCAVSAWSSGSTDRTDVFNVPRSSKLVISPTLGRHIDQHENGPDPVLAIFFFQLLVYATRTEAGMSGQDSPDSRPAGLSIGKITPMCSCFQQE
jgi:hypothetical protein